MTVKILARIIVAAVLLCAWRGGAQAAIIMDVKLPPKSKLTDYKSGVDAIDAAVSGYIQHKIVHREPFIPFDLINRMQFNGQIYYSSAVAFLSKNEMDNKDPNRHIAGGGVCALFITDENLKVIAWHKINLPEANSHTWCYSLNGIQPVAKQDAVLIALSYYMTDGRLTKDVGIINNDRRDMMVLLRLKQENGKVSISQDDRCLGNPNPYTNSASALKAMKGRAACAAH